MQKLRLTGPPRVHVDQGRLATNKTTGTNAPLLSVIVPTKDAGDTVVASGHRVEVRCRCGELVGAFVQPDPVHAHFELAEGAAFESQIIETR